MKKVSMITKCSYCGVEIIEIIEVPDDYNFEENVVSHGACDDCFNEVMKNIDNDMKGGAVWVRR